MKKLETPLTEAEAEEDINRLFALRRTVHYVKAFYGAGCRRQIMRYMEEETANAMHWPHVRPDRLSHLRIIDGASLADELLGTISENEYRAIFNGWHPRKLMDPIRQQSRFPLVPVLDFDPLTSDGTVISEDDAVWYRGNMVTLRVKEGATLLQIIDALAELNQHIPCWFNRVIAGGMSEGPIEVQGSKRGEEVKL